MHLGEHGKRLPAPQLLSVLFADTHRIDLVLKPTSVGPRLKTCFATYALRASLLGLPRFDWLDDGKVFAPSPNAFMHGASGTPTNQGGFGLPRQSSLSRTFKRDRRQAFAYASSGYGFGNRWVRSRAHSAVYFTVVNI